MNWCPIETIPDATEVLLLLDSGHCVVGSRGFNYGDGTIFGDGEWFAGQGYSGHDADISGTPIQWMPLPKATSQYPKP